VTGAVGIIAGVGQMLADQSRWCQGHLAVNKRGEPCSPSRAKRLDPIGASYAVAGVKLSDDRWDRSANEHAAAVAMMQAAALRLEPGASQRPPRARRGAGGAAAGLRVREGGGGGVGARRGGVSLRRPQNIVHRASKKRPRGRSHRGRLRSDRALERHADEAAVADLVEVIRDFGSPL